MNNSFTLLLMIAAVWYLAFVLTKMGGPFGMFDKLRERKQGRWHGRTFYWNPAIDHRTEKIFNRDGLLDCIVCLMPYIGAGVLLLHHFRLDLIYYPFSIAGLALWAHGLTGWIGRSA